MISTKIQAPVFHALLTIKLAGELRRSRDLVRRAIALRVTLGVIDANQNTRIIRGISTREADRRTCLRARARHVDLSASHVELSGPLLRSRVQGDDLRAEKVLPWCDAGRQCEVYPTTTADLRDLRRCSTWSYAWALTILSTPHDPEPSRPSSATLNHLRPLG